jgi:hypothetical protein
VVLGVGGGGESGQDHLIPALLAGNPDLCHVVARHPRLLVGAHPLVIKALMVGVTDNSDQSLQQQANIILQMTNSYPAAAYYPDCDNPSTSSSPLLAQLLVSSPVIAAAAASSPDLHRILAVHDRFMEVLLRSTQLVEALASSHPLMASVVASHDLRVAVCGTPEV